MRSWYTIEAKAEAVNVLIYDEIGFFGIPASQLVSDLQGLKGKVLNVYINSPGGDAYDGIAIYTALSRHDAPVHVTVDGLAASIASVIAQAGETRVMAPAAIMMVHEARGVAMGPSSEMEKMIEQLQVVDAQIAGIYAEKAGGTPEEWRSVMANETWYKAEDAVAAGLAERVANTPTALAERRVFNLSKFGNVPEWVKEVDNSTPNPPEEPGEEPEPSDKETEMAELTAIRQALGLDDDGDILASIQTLKDAAKDIATGETGIENQLRKELGEARQQILSQGSEYSQRILTLEEKYRNTEAKYKVESAVQQGRVAPKDRDIAMKLALTDPDAFETFAGSLRVDLNERGAALDAQMAELEPTQDELKVGAQMGLTREQIIQQKAADKGVTIPA